MVDSAPTRRSVLRAAAWAAPAVAVAAAVPALAATGDGTIDLAGVSVLFAESDTSQFTTTGSISLSPDPASPTTLTAEFTWLGTNGNTTAGVWFFDQGPGGWTALNAIDPNTDVPYPSLSFTRSVTGSTQVPFVSPPTAFAAGTDAAPHLDGILTVTLSAPGYTTASRSFTYTAG